MNKSLSDMHVFIAGGLGEIGMQTSLELIQNEAKVTILHSSDKNLGNLKFLKTDNINLIKVNYLNYENLYDVFLKNAQKGKVNSLISAVGTGKANGIYPYTNEEVRKLWDLNFFANRNLAIAITEFLLKKKEYNLDYKSSHILTSSIASQINVSAPIDYVTSKAALESLVKSLSYQVSPFQRINSVSPGHIYTKHGVWGRNSIKKPKFVKNMINDKIPLNRLGTTDDIAQLFLFLLSGKSSYITGTNIICDGGLKAKT